MNLLRLLLRALFGPPKRRPRYRPPATPVAERLADRAQAPARPGAPVQIAQVTEINGRCWVIDGDTIDIRGTRIRLAGIDAPEIGDPHGQAAKGALLRLCHGQIIRAVTEGEVSHQRLVATCYLADGRDLSAEMVRAGLALDWTKFSRGKYRGLEPEGIRKKLWRCDARQKGRVPVRLPD
jgi:micrococcal nuclease